MDFQKKQNKIKFKNHYNYLFVCKYEQTTLIKNYLHNKLKNNYFYHMTRYFIHFYMWLLYKFYIDKISSYNFFFYSLGKKYSNYFLDHAKNKKLKYNNYTIFFFLSFRVSRVLKK